MQAMRIDCNRIADNDLSELDVVLVLSQHYKRTLYQMQRELHDHYFRRAKREGYLSRAAYKLLELNEKKSLLRSENRVLDCGCAPGSWLQVAIKKVGNQGRVVGVDLSPIEHKFFEKNIHLIQGDLSKIPSEQLLGYLNSGKFDVILSDMAPRTTGARATDHHASIRLCDMVLERCNELLAEEGNLVMKVFEGEAYSELIARCKILFSKVKGFVPKASRDQSTEIYIVCSGFLGKYASETDINEGTTDSDAFPHSKPSRGWKK